MDVIVGVGEYGVAVAVDEGDVGVASAAKVIATAVGMISGGKGVGIEGDAELLH